MKKAEIIAPTVMTGTEFEEATVKLLRSLGFEANKTSSNDGGVDIVCKVKCKNEYRTFYIQCKYYNKSLGKAPVQEIFSAVHYYDEPAEPVVFTNNTVTYEARVYARKLGVEIIADTEYKKFLRVVKSKEIKDPNIHTGLLGLMMTKVSGNVEYYKKILELTSAEADTTSDINKEHNEFKLEIKTQLEEAEECAKEASALQEKAALFSQRAISLQKQAILRNLDYI